MSEMTVSSADGFDEVKKRLTEFAKSLRKEESPKKIDLEDSKLIDAQFEIIKEQEAKLKSIEAEKTILKNKIRILQESVDKKEESSSKPNDQEIKEQNEVQKTIVFSIKQKDETNKTFSDKVISVFKKVNDKFESTLKGTNYYFDSIVSYLNKPIKLMRVTSLPGFTKISNALQPGPVYTKVMKTLNTMGEYFKHFSGKTMDSLFSVFGTEIGGGLSKMVGFFGNIGYNILNYIANTGVYILEKGYALVKGLAGIGWELVSKVFSTVAELSKAAGSFILDVFLDVISNPAILVAAYLGYKYLFGSSIEKAIKPLFSKIWNWISGTISDLFTGVGNKTLDAIGLNSERKTKLEEKFTTVFESVKDFGGGASKILTNMFGPSWDFGLMTGVYSKFSSIKDSAMKTFNDMWSTVATEGFMNSIQSMWKIITIITDVFANGKSVDESTKTQEMIEKFDDYSVNLMQKYGSLTLQKNIYQKIMELYKGSVTPELIQQATQYGLEQQELFLKSISEKVPSGVIKNLQFPVDKIVNDMIKMVSDPNKDVKAKRNEEMLKDMDTFVSKKFGETSKKIGVGTATISEIQDTINTNISSYGVEQERTGKIFENAVSKDTDRLKSQLNLVSARIKEIGDGSKESAETRIQLQQEFTLLISRMSKVKSESEMTSVIGEVMSFIRKNDIKVDPSIITSIAKNYGYAVSLRTVSHGRGGSKDEITSRKINAPVAVTTPQDNPKQEDKPESIPPNKTVVHFDPLSGILRDETGKKIEDAK